MQFLKLHHYSLKNRLASVEL